MTQPGSEQTGETAGRGSGGGTLETGGGFPERVVFAPLAGRAARIPGGSFVIAEWMDEGGISSRSRPIAPLHLHHHDEEAWYVLEGALGFRLGEDELQAEAGSAVIAPPGTPHTYWNAGSGAARYLLVMTSRIHDLIQGIHALSERTPEALAALFRAHDSELL